jgi:hypothetical protein
VPRAPAALDRAQLAKASRDPRGARRDGAVGGGARGDGLDERVRESIEPRTREPRRYRRGVSNQRRARDRPPRRRARARGERAESNHHRLG